MAFDQQAGPELPLPDHVPDDLTARYGASARRTIRRSRSRAYPVFRRVARGRGTARALAHNSDLWLTTLTVFAWSIVAAGAVGAVVYAVMLVPRAALFVVLPVGLLLALSFGAATRLVRRRERDAEPADR
jgi:hypothetical protein